ncbi:hypothetical protein [Actinomadura sp. DC4]|uniref:hypothetical protein n=1 Tax=Actinomadura sp. DC4 TaxID=3055069 RepID=UPI0025B1F055|nr:hypothetical protein [Actinomadura sp. DC4]MDN3359972.1 hypothetical protein [Actinomadura sp. DC4]
MQKKSDIKQLPRRSVLAGAVALGASAATAKSIFSPTAATADSTLNGWRFCANCFELFLVDFTVDQSLCPRTRGPHQAAGWTFRLTYNLSPAGTGESGNTQASWRHCYRCAALYWGPGALRCPAGGSHGYIHPSGYPRQFLLPHDIGEPARMQHQWRYCFKCSALFYNGYAYKGQYGLCPYDYIYGHTAAGYDFAIPVSAYT